VRSAADEDPERVLVLRTLGAPERRLLRGRRGRTLTEAQPEPVPTTRATVIRAAPFPDEAAAEQWLAQAQDDDERTEAELDDALRRLNAAVRAHRAAAGDPYPREVSAGQALTVRLGFGKGDAVAEGRFASAWEPAADRRRRARRSMEAPEERFAALLGGREGAMACEELVLRARVDVDAKRPREAALQARVALEALLSELAERLPDDQRAALDADREPVARAAGAALQDDPAPADREAVAAAVGRMEAALKRYRLGR
jgi:hypothetical protein